MNLVTVPTLSNSHPIAERGEWNSDAWAFRRLREHRAFPPKDNPGFFMVVCAGVWAAILVLLGVPVVYCLASEIAVVLLMIVVVRTTPSTLYVSAEDTDLLMHSGDEEVQLVETWILQSNRVSGRDRGLLWFDAGILYFLGKRCSFWLRAEDILSAESAHYSPGSLPKRATKLRLSGLRATEVWFKALLHEGAESHWVDTELRAQIQQFATDRDVADPAVVSRYPPLSIGPTESLGSFLELRRIGLFLLAIAAAPGPIWAMFKHNLSLEVLLPLFVFLSFPISVLAYIKIVRTHGRCVRKAENGQ